MKTASMLLVVGGCVAPSLAQVTVYLDRTAWEAAVGDFMVEDFNTQTPGIIADGSTLDTGMLQITRDGSPNGGDGLLEIEPGGNFGNLDGTTFLSGETGASPHENVLVEFGGQSIYAFGADWFSPFSGDGIGIQVGNELILLDSITGFNTGFVGFVLESGTVDSISIVGNPDAVTFQELWSADNFSYAVPAPSALALLGAGGLIASRRRRA